MHERDKELIENYTILDELSGKIPKICNKRVYIKQHPRFSLISTDVEKPNKSLIYFDIRGQRYGYIVLSNLNMKVYGSYCEYGDPFDSLIEDLEKYDKHTVTIMYPRKHILLHHNPKKFHVIWDSFHFVEPDHREQFLKTKLSWDSESPYYSVDMSYNTKQISHIKKGKLFSVYQHQNTKFKTKPEGQFRFDEILV